MSRLCSLVSFLISFPLVRLSCGCGIDSDDFFPLFLKERMNDQWNRALPYGSDCYPSIFLFDSEITLCNSVGVVKNENGRFKSNIVLT